MAAGRLLLLPSSFVLLFYANLLSAFLGEQSAVSEGKYLRLRSSLLFVLLLRRPRVAMFGRYVVTKCFWDVFINMFPGTEGKRLIST